jgi:hypothetical protein
MRLGLVRVNLDGLLGAIEGPLPRRMNRMMMLHVTVTRIPGLPVSATARRVHVVCAMAAHLLVSLGNVHSLPGMPVRFLDI